MHICFCDLNLLTMSQTNQTVSVGRWSQDCGSMGHFLEYGSFTAVLVQNGSYVGQTLPTMFPLSIGEKENK